MDLISQGVHLVRFGTTSRVTLYTAGHLHTAVPHCSHSRAPIVHTAVPRENNEHGCVYLRCRAVCKLPGCVEGHPWTFQNCNEPWAFSSMMTSSHGNSFCITGSLWGEDTGDRWIPLTKASDADLWWFLWFTPEQNCWTTSAVAGDLRRHDVHVASL